MSTSSTPWRKESFRGLLLGEAVLKIVSATTHCRGYHKEFLPTIILNCYSTTTTKAVP